ncbi:MAG: hypothetical protein K9J17_00635 [Flavobacteriales bacterium]|nr:hypothetical protein [Flavobacteriales bacterium]
MNHIGTTAHRSLLFFALFGVLFIPFSFSTFRFQTELTRYIFQDLILFASRHFEILDVTNPEISSDSAALYWLFLMLLILAVIATTVLSFFTFEEKQLQRMFGAIQIILTYYLSVIMLKYGFDKIFGIQFYIPEPNTLYTPLGMLDRDIAFWSVMGTSYSYSLFMGMMEVVPSLMLWFRRTRILGIIILLGVLTHVVFVNLCFDISVKLFSSFLLLQCFILLIPHFKSLARFLILKKAAVLFSFSGIDIVKSRKVRYAIKTTVLILISFESIYPHIENGHSHNANQIVDGLHGAYEIVKIESDSDNTNLPNMKRFFVHRSSYLIFQYQDDSMEDYRLEASQSSNTLILTDYDGQMRIFHYQYSTVSDTLELKSNELGITIYSKPIPWHELPILQPLFHFTVDEI